MGIKESILISIYSISFKEYKFAKFLLSIIIEKKKLYILKHSWVQLKYDL